MYHIDDIKKLCPLAKNEILDKVIPELNKYLINYSINNKDREVHFISQISYESFGFSTLEENLNYSAKRICQVWPKFTSLSAGLANNPEKLANYVYANKNGNGDEFSGDGWRYRGRGLIQITGRWNYSFFSNVSKINILDNPEKASNPENAALIALSFWSYKKCNELADVNDVQKITKAINGNRMEGLEARKALTKRAYEVIK